MGFIQETSIRDNHPLLDFMPISPEESRSLFHAIWECPEAELSLDYNTKPSHGILLQLRRMLEDFPQWKTHFQMQTWRLEESTRRKVQDRIANAPHVVLEPYCGTAWFSLLYSAYHPRSQCFAIDRSGKRLSVGMRILEGQQNLKERVTLARSEVLPFLTFVCPDECADTVAVLYPNPYPKNTQIQKRFGEGYVFLRTLEVLKPSGTLVFVTDQEFLFQAMRQQLQALTFFGLGSLRCWDLSHEDISCFTPRTAFERKYRTQRRPVFQIEFKKKFFTLESLTESIEPIL